MSCLHNSNRPALVLHCEDWNITETPLFTSFSFLPRLCFTLCTVVWVMFACLLSVVELRSYVLTWETSELF